MSTRIYTPYVFEPASDGMLSISCNTTSQCINLGHGEQIRIVNLGPDNCHIAFGISNTVTATVNSMILIANTVEVITIPKTAQTKATYIAAISDTSNNILQITTGWGI